MRHLDWGAGRIGAAKSLDSITIPDASPQVLQGETQRQFAWRPDLADDSFDLQRLAPRTSDNKTV